MNLRTTPHSLIIDLQKTEKLWALKRGLRVPLAAIDNIDFTSDKPTMKGLWNYLRIPGTALPGVFLAGTYIKRGSREFWYLRMHQSGVLSVHIKSGMYHYDRLRLTCTPHNASAIMRWWHAH